MNYSSFCERIHVPRETFERLEIYVQLLLKWQQKINLISQHTIDDVWERHILDGIQLLPLLEIDETTIPTQFVDMGSGGGVPGIILGLCLDHPIQLQESDQRKCTFLETVSRETSRENISIYHGRIEESTIHNASHIFARALSSLDSLLTLAFPQLSENGSCFFHKGIHVNEELEEAKKRWNFTNECFESITQPNAAIVKLTNIGPIA